MEKEEYLKNIEENIQKILDESLFNNYKNQLVAKKLGASFTSTYKEEYLWNKLLYISINSCILISQNINEKLTNATLKICGKIYEDLSKISEEYDTEYCLILSALCYDLAGYQANSGCLIKRLEMEYGFESQNETIEINSSNYILKHIQQILLKRISKANSIINHKLDENPEIRYFNGTMELFYSNILNGDENDLDGNENNFIFRLNKQYRYYLKKNNVPMAHLFLLLRTKILKYMERSIRKNLNYNTEIKDNAIWKKYIKLLTHDLYERNRSKDINKRTSISELWISQLRAIESGLLEKEKNFIIQMPTSAGKTFIAEIAILNHLIKFPQKKCIYIAPFKALMNEKEDELSKNLSKLGYSVSMLSGSYEMDDYQHLLMEETDVLIATPEKVDLLFRANKAYFNNVSLIVVDEGHIVGDISPRASLLEFLIIRLKIKIPDLKILFISAVMPPHNADEYSSWLNNGDTNNVIRALLNRDSNPNEQWEPTLKLIGKFTWSGEKGRIDFKDINTEDEITKAKKGVFTQGIIEVKKYGRKKFPKKQNKAEVAAYLAWKLSIEKGGTFIFCGKTTDVNSVCKAYLRLFELEKENFPESLELESYYYAKIWLGENHEITNCIKRGIGAHYGDLPEQLRNAVENDFKSGKLRILISTTTIGQGVNLPIRNVIFHSTIIGRNLKIKSNDFLNIIGRAGRAGMETEGMIIFLIKSDIDKQSYNYFTDKNNLEPANSLFFNVLKSLSTRILNDEEYQNFITILSESYLFDLMIDESLSESEAIDKIIDNSLFKVQIGSDELLDISILKNSFVNIYNNIKQHIDGDKLKVYGMTGLSLGSNQIIYEYIEEHKKELEDIVSNDDYMALLINMFSLFDKGTIREIYIKKLEGVPLTSYLDLIILWINGASINETRKKWTEMNLGDISKLFVLLSKGFEYLFSWLIYAFLTILSYHLNIELSKFPINIRNLAGYIKFGTNNPVVCLARAMGIKSRESAKALSELFESTGGGTPTGFIKFVSDLNYYEIKQLDLSEYELDNINSVSLRLRPKEKEEEKSNILFEIKGIYHEKERRKPSLEVELGDDLSMEREYDNPHDPYAILLLKNGKELGYIPKELSKRIGTDIDLGNIVYRAKVLRIKKGKQYNNIYCELLR